MAADAAGCTNIEWVQALAEELPGAAPGPYRLVTFGQSFHWTDELRVADTVYDILEPTGAMAMIVPGPAPCKALTSSARSLTDTSPAAETRIKAGKVRAHVNRMEEKTSLQVSRQNVPDNMPVYVSEAAVDAVLPDG